ncbi:MAG: hypothetical protein HKN47_20730 [Pirellulaceae bacterium]|nr:hypothetical protein [Pirellulaceae bacterium]
MRWLLLYLRFVGGFTLLAFAAAMMPEGWMITIAKLLTIDPFPDSPLTFYLARNLSLLYGFIGIGLLVIASDLRRYRPQVRLLAFGTMAFGILQVVCNSMSSLPWWWSFGEGLSTVGGGILMYYLDSRAGESNDAPQR